MRFKFMPTRHFGIIDSWTRCSPLDFLVTPAVLHGFPCPWGSLGVPGNTSRKMLTELPLFNSYAEKPWTGLGAVLQK